MSVDRRTRRQLAALAANALLLLLNVTPSASPATWDEPFVLGLPFALAWIVASVALSFLVLLWLYLGEADGRAEPTS